MRIVNPTLSSLLVWVFDFNKSGHELTDMADDVIVSQRSKNLQIDTRDKWKFGNMAGTSIPLFVTDPATNGRMVKSSHFILL